MKLAFKDSADRDFSARQYEFGGVPKAQCLVLPGAQVSGERYEWLGIGLAALGCHTWVIDPPIIYQKTRFSPDKPTKTQFLSFSNFNNVLQNVCDPSLPLVLVGHSWGGSLILETLDPENAKENATLGLPQDFVGIPNLLGCVVLGASLQAEAFGMTIPGRSNQKPLNKPENIGVLLIAGEHDRQAPPDDVLKTCSRYPAHAYFIEQPGANHLQWANGTGWADRPDLDGTATVDAGTQQRHTLSYIEAFIDGLITEKLTGASSFAALVSEIGVEKGD